MLWHREFIIDTSVNNHLTSFYLLGEFMARLKPEARRDQILTAALQVAAKPNGWSYLNRRAVANAANCSEGLVSKYFGTVKKLRKTVMVTAVSREILPIIIQGIMAQDKCALKAPFALKAAAIQSLG